jgi:hypothetical protein
METHIAGYTDVDFGVVMDIKEMRLNLNLRIINL